MTQLSSEDWLEFNAIVDANGPSTNPSLHNEIVFRGSDEEITLEYVRVPFEDSILVSELLEKDPNKFKDAGFHTILPVAKSLEMHIRLLALGNSKKQFENSDFHLSKCLNSIQKMVDGKVEISDKFEGFNKKNVPFSGDLFDNFMSRKSEKSTRMINKARYIYLRGNPYRHNKVKSWTEIKSEFKNIRKAFNQFTKLFNELVG